MVDLLYILYNVKQRKEIVKKEKKEKKGISREKEKEEKIKNRIKPCENKAENTSPGNLLQSSQNRPGTFTKVPRSRNEERNDRNEETGAKLNRGPAQVEATSLVLQRSYEDLMLTSVI